MTNIIYFLPMQHTHRLFLLAYDGCQLLDVTGPAAVFGAANEAVGRRAYDLRILSPDGGMVATNSGVAIQTRRFGGRADTLLVAGGSRGLPAVTARTDVRRWLQRMAPFAARYGSVCTGAFVLAAAGLLDGKRVATHWASCEKLARRYPALSVDADALYVVDGKVWTSAGVTTGIDMALALVEADLGASVANLIARHFVLYARRPGYQSQFSPLLQVQTKAEAPFAALIEWMQSHLDAALDVPALARRAGLSERSFYRKFTGATGKTPAQFVERLRLEAARTLMTRDLPLKVIAGRVGLGSPARLGAAFERGFGMTPSLFREMHRPG
ncbi:GlxA family transcriptional regulator [Enhydrobacter sp.]|jgi:transcriptional regulator GlxA family with amidase domain|uniref:GlxA family transcriptional regulator n=1 Tax=Enhydrobacter sp. TaxID=1894999 RepID=UPI0026149460|nr:GlxA family transcriptional regulator [Enhydrobacter sp.]WIM10106.1 MAG: Transcriptional regulator, AraC family [Enhydrobacter sp.]